MEQQQQQQQPKARNPAAILGVFSWALAFSAMSQGTTMIALPYEAKRLAPERASSLTGAVAAAGSAMQVLGLVVTHFSDRTTFRWGRRRPYILGAALGAAGSAVLWCCGSAAGSLAFIVSAFLLMWAFISSGITVLEALMPDLLPQKQQGLAGGMLGLLQVLGTAIAFGLFSFETAMWVGMIVFAGLSAVLAVPTMLLAHETPLPKQRSSNAEQQKRKSRTQRTREALQAFLFSPRAHPDWLLLLVIRVLFFIGVSFSSLMQFWIGDLLKIHNAETFVATTGLITLGVCVLVSVPAGFLSDKIGRKPLLVCSLVALLAGALLMLFARGSALVYSAIVVFGLGNGIFPVTEIAVCCDCIPRSRDAGKFVAEFTLMQTVGQLIGQLCDSQVLQHFSLYSSTSSSSSISSSSSDYLPMYAQTGYTAIFSISAGSFAIALVLALLLSPTRGKAAQEPAPAETIPDSGSCSPSSTAEDSTPAPAEPMLASAVVVDV